jgi:hypothetical protein
VLSFDVDDEAPILAEGDRYAKDLSTISHQAYGPRVGVPRIIKLLAADDIEATFFVPGVTAERWPGTVEEIHQSGHEVALHGHFHRVLPGIPSLSSAGTWRRAWKLSATLASSPAAIEHRTGG